MKHENIISLEFSKKQKFFSILYHNLNIEIFSLPIEKNNKTISCNCEKKFLAPLTNLDCGNEISSSQNKKEAKGIKKFFTGAFSKIKQIFNKKKNSISSYKYDPFNLLDKNYLSSDLQEVSLLKLPALENAQILIQFEKMNEIVRIR